MNWIWLYEKSFSMNITDLTIVYFIEDYNQEKIINLKHKDYQHLKLLFVYSNLKPKIFHDNLLFTDKNFFNDILALVFSKVETDCFIYLKPEETIPFISSSENFNQPYYFFEVNYHFQTDKLINHELRFYNKNKIINQGIENINNDHCHKKIVIDNYQYFYQQIEKSIVKKHLNLLKKEQYREDSVIYLLNYNLKLFIENSFEDKFLLDIKTLLKLKTNFENNQISPEYLSITLNLGFSYLKNNDYDQAFKQLNDLEGLFPNSPNLLYLFGIFHSLKNNYLQAIEYFNKVVKLKDNYYKYAAVPYSWLNYSSIYQKGKMYIKLEQIDKAIEQFEICLNNNPSNELIEELNFFISNNKVQIVETNFNCQTCGNCCRTKLINITHNDVERILDNRNDLIARDFIDYLPINENMDEYNHGDKFLSDNHKNMVVLKKKSTKHECIFLDNQNKCSINEFKPLACKAWPFVVRESDNKLMWAIHEREFIKNHCAHILTKNNNVDQIKNDIVVFKKDRSAFFETVYNWNSLDKSLINQKENFLDYALKYSNKNISLFKNSITDKLENLFSNNQNISLFELDPFTSLYFKETNSTFSYALYLDDLGSFLNNDSLEKIKVLLDAEHYTISRQPETFISFYINHSDQRYVLNIFIYHSQTEISIHHQTKIIFKDQLFKVNTLNTEEMFNFKINYLTNRFQVILNNFSTKEYNNDNLIKAYQVIEEIIFSLLSWLNQKPFEYLKHNKFNYIPHNFNNYLLSYNQNLSNEKEFKKFINNSYETFFKILKLYEKYNSNLTINKYNLNQVF